MKNKIVITYILGSVLLFMCAVPVFAQEESPVVKESESATTVEAVTTTSKVIDKIPESVRRRADEAGTALESFRITQAGKFAVRRDELAGSIAVEKQAEEDSEVSSTEDPETPSSSIKDVLRQLHLLALEILAFVFGKKLLFYIVGVLLVLFVIRKIYRAWRGPSWDV